jgi:hypothetical protein
LYKGGEGGAQALNSVASYLTSLFFVLFCLLGFAVVFASFIQFNRACCPPCSSKSLSDLIKLFPGVLALATEQKPLYVFVDGMTEGNWAWVPSVLPPNARLVVSVVQIQHLQQQQQQQQQQPTPGRGKVSCIYKFYTSMCGPLIFVSIISRG